VGSISTESTAGALAAAATRARARVVGLSVVARHNRTRAVREIAAMQPALPADVQLWLGGADAERVAARVPAFRGMVVDRLSAANGELARIAVSEGSAATTIETSP
jgi:hypothetical protein